MHCPRCGQEQVSGNLKFCSRCGLPMTMVSEIVNRGGDLPAPKKAGGGIFTRTNGFKVSLVWFLLIDFLIVPLVAIAGGEEEVAVLAVIGFVGAAIIAVLSALFLSNPEKQTGFAVPASDYSLPTTSDQRDAGALPAGDARPASDYVSPPGSWRAPDTGDLVRPGSVTEETTKLLQKEEESD